MWAIAKKLKIQGPGSLKQNPEASPPEHTESYPCSPINLTLTDPFQTSYPLLSSCGMLSFFFKTLDNFLYF